MLNNKEASKGKHIKGGVWQFIRRNGLTIFLGLAIVTMVVNPDAKSWVLQQLMRTGFFNAKIESKTANVSTQSPIDFDFRDETGKIENTSSLRGKVVFINFWASWCPPCRAEFPSIETLYSKFKDNPHVFFLTINEDNDPSMGKAYLDKEKFSILMYQLYDNVPEEVYSGSLPTTVVLGKDGKVRFHHEGFANYGTDKFEQQIDELINE